MLTKYFSKARNLFKFTLLFGVVVLLSYCTSSPKTASSFGKRKYTRGHFSDRVAKVKMEYKPSDENTAAALPETNKSEQAANNVLNTITDKNALPFIFSPKAQTFFSHLKPVKQAIALANSPAGAANNNASLKESSVSAAYPYQEHGYLHDRAADNDHKRSTFLIAWLLCLAVALLCILLFAAYAASVSSSGGTTSTLGTGCFLITLMTLAFIGAIVFFILWIVALSS